MLGLILFMPHRQPEVLVVHTTLKEDNIKLQELDSFCISSHKHTKNGTLCYHASRFHFLL